MKTPCSSTPATRPGACVPLLPSKPAESAPELETNGAPLAAFLNLPFESTEDRFARLEEGKAKIISAYLLTVAALVAQNKWARALNAEVLARTGNLTSIVRLGEEAGAAAHRAHEAAVIAAPVIDQPKD